MLRHFVAICALLLAVSLPAYATNVTFVVPAEKIGPVLTGPTVDLSSSTLNGMTLTGQSMSLDLMFANNILARLSLTNPDPFGVDLIISTSLPSAPGFAGTTTGFLRDAAGNPFGPTQTAGRAMADDGTFSIGLSEFTGPALNIDSVGLHFDTAFPNSPGRTITNTTLLFTLGSGNNVRFGTPQQLPEPASILLLGFGFIGLLFLATRRVKV
jgi:hypothetical protein